MKDAQEKEIILNNAELTDDELNQVVGGFGLWFFKKKVSIHCPHCGKNSEIPERDVQDKESVKCRKCGQMIDMVTIEEEPVFGSVR